ncbi:MAG: hypothetical protein QW097_00260 [archaeon]
MKAKRVEESKEEREIREWERREAKFQKFAHNLEKRIWVLNQTGIALEELLREEEARADESSRKTIEKMIQENKAEKELLEKVARHFLARYRGAWKDPQTWKEVEEAAKKFENLILQKSLYEYRKEEGKRILGILEKIQKTAEAGRLADIKEEEMRREKVRREWEELRRQRMEEERLAAEAREKSIKTRLMRGLSRIGSVSKERQGITTRLGRALIGFSAVGQLFKGRRKRI